MLTIDNYYWFMKRYVDLVNERYKEPGIEMFNNVTTSVIRAMVSDESESNVEVDVAKWLFEGWCFWKLLFLFIGVLQWTLILAGT